MGRSVGTAESSRRGRSGREVGLSHSDMKSVSSLMKRLQRDHANESSQVILPKLHKIIKQNKRKIRFDFRKLKEKLRICKVCDKWNNLSNIIQCTICEDNYHITCLKVAQKEAFRCEPCVQGKRVLKNCGKCKEVVQVSQKRHCKACPLIFHNKCLSKDGKCKKCLNLQKQAKKSLRNDPKQVYKKKILNEDTTTTATSALFRYQRLVKTERELEKYTDSLMEAIRNKNMLYSESLVNMEEFRDILNENSMDFGINLMRKSEEEAYRLYKSFPIGPFLFRMIKGKGYDVIADRDIPERSLICEYVGQVVTLRECIELQKYSRNDSLMQLQSGKNSEETLIIRPERFTNMARFINGVRKNSNEGNVETMKMLYRGRPLVLLVSKRPISKGESLCYDYNAGGITAEYDTSHFL